MAGAGADQYTFHYEATEDVGGCIRKIKEANMKVHITRVFDFTYFSRSQMSNFEIFTICSNTLTIGRIFTKFLSWIHLILPRFLI
jgi:hypothetical protein